jgi:polyferredoxin
MSHSSPKTPHFRWPLAALALVYLAAIGLCLCRVEAPRWFWTMAMPAVPVFAVAFGFHRWRRLCPLAAVAAVGPRLHAGKRRAPRWLDRWGPLIAFALLLVGLVVRHAMINGDHHCLGCALAVIAALAVATNALFSGRAWCNFLCPVGIVERIYTDGGALLRTKSSRCPRCTGCTPSCPDIDQDRAFRSSRERTATRIATFAFPGLVFGFYAYYWLRYGEWAAFFDGAWTLRAFDRELWLGAGFTFAPAIPAIAACTLTLVGAAGVSLFAFLGAERSLIPRVQDRGALRQRMLALAAFAAFGLFYLFAGQPTLREYPILDWVVCSTIPVLSTLVLVRRWSAAASSARAHLPVVAQGQRGPGP